MSQILYYWSSRHIFPSTLLNELAVLATWPMCSLTQRCGFWLRCERNRLLCPWCCMCQNSPRPFSYYILLTLGYWYYRRCRSYFEREKKILEIFLVIKLPIQKLNEPSMLTSGPRQSPAADPCSGLWTENRS